MCKKRIEYLTNKMYYGYLDGDETKEYIEHINELLKENQQLKEELQKADSITQSCIFEGKEESEINFRKAINLIEQYKSVLDEIREDIIFCINGMKNEYACTDKRTNRELHTMVKILEDRLQILDKENKNEKEN